MGRKRKYPPDKEDLVSDLKHIRESLLLAEKFKDLSMVHAQIIRLNLVLFLLSENSVGGYRFERSDTGYGV